MSFCPQTVDITLLIFTHIVQFLRGEGVRTDIGSLFQAREVATGNVDIPMQARR